MKYQTRINDKYVQDKGHVLYYPIEHERQMKLEAMAQRLGLQSNNRVPDPKKGGKQ